MRKSRAARVVEKINKLETDERIIACYRRLRRIDATANCVALASIVAGFIYTGCCVAGAAHHPERLLPILAVVIASAVTLYWVGTMPMFQPLAESDQCKTALHLVRAHAVARAVRDDALCRGRQLYVADAVLMQEARWQRYYEELDAEREETRRAQCAELHGLS